jgi:hypothetical protein
MYAAARHGVLHRLPHLEIEINQARLGGHRSIAGMGRVLARALRAIRVPTALR